MCSVYSYDKEGVIISLDLEWLGPNPNVHSVIALAAISYAQDGTRLSQFSANIKTINPSFDSKTMKWWSTQLKAWEQNQENQQDPIEVFSDFVTWINQFDNYVWLVYNGALDIQFLQANLKRFAKADLSEFYWQSIELRAYLMGALSLPWESTAKRNWRDSVTLQNVETVGKLEHTPLVDCEIQADAFWRVANRKDF